jgi:hypothetical protein
VKAFVPEYLVLKLSFILRTSRYEVRSQRLDFSLTDTQLPMFMRIFKLVLALYNGEIEQHLSHGEGQVGKTGADGANGEN